MLPSAHLEEIFFFVCVVARYSGNAVFSCFP